MPFTRGQNSYLSPTRRPLLSLCIRVFHPNTRIYVRLLGPCFRRVDENHFVNITYPATALPHSVSDCHTDRTLFSHALGRTGARRRTSKKRAGNRLDQSRRRAHGLKRPRRNAPFHELSPTESIDVNSLKATGPPGELQEKRLQHKEYKTPISSTTRSKYSL